MPLRPTCARETVLRVQSGFRQEAGSDTTLRKLHDYIRDCSAVVCIIGKRNGALPPPKAAEPFAHMTAAPRPLKGCHPLPARSAGRPPPGGGDRPSPHHRL